MKHKGSLFQWTSDFYENAFVPVPGEGRKSTSTVLFVTMGYMATLSCFVIGVKVGYALPFGQAVLACIVGNLILMGIGILMGIIGFETGWSTTFLIRKMFGKNASLLVSGLIILLSIYWVGMNGDSFARMIVTVLPHWPIPVAVTAVVLVALWGMTAAYGWRGLAMTSFILTPLAVVWAISGVGMLYRKMDVVQVIQNFTPHGNLTITTAIAAVAGNYIFGCIVSPDHCRFAKSRKAVVQIILPSYTIGFILFNICGVLVAQLGNSPEFGVGVAKLGLAVPYLICAAMTLWTTENYNMYCGSLAIQNLFLGTPVEGNLSHRLATGVLAGLSAAFAAMEALNYLMPVVTLIAGLVPPVAGILFAEYFVFRPNQKYSIHRGTHWIWIPAWIVGSTVGIWSYYANFLISPVNALVVSGFIYVIIKMIVNRKIHCNKN